MGGDVAVGYSVPDMEDGSQRDPLASGPGDADSITRRPRFADSYGLVLACLVGFYFVTAAAGDNRYGRMVALILLAVTTWLALRASRIERRVPRYGLVLIGLATLAGVVFGLSGNGDLAKLVTVTLNAVLIIVAPVAIIRRLLTHRVVDVETFFGAVCVYLMIAMFFASSDTLIGLATGEPFFAQNPPAVTSTDYLYFSLVTITTTGYGDLTAAGQVGRLMAMSEAVLGQLYLITVVAMVVQNLGQERKSRGRGPARRD
jgi:hypothetical protein